MADFNPAPPQQQPQEYTNLSRPLSPIYSYMASNKSGEILASGLGHDIAEGAEAADATLKKHIDYQMHQVTDEQTDAFSTALEDVKYGQQHPPQQQPGQQLPQTGMWQQQGYGLSQPQDNPPPAIDNNLDKISTLHEGNAQGKVTEAYYLSNMYSIAKSMRSQYPGYRDYIDQQMHEITGRPIANLYLSSMLEDINKNNAGTGNKLQEQRLTALYDANKEGAPGADMMLKRLAAGDPTLKGEDIDTFVNKANYYKYHDATLKSAVYNQTTGQTQDNSAATRYVNTTAATDVAQTVTHTLQGIGVNTDGPPEAYMDKLSGMNLQGGQAEQAGQMFDSAYKAEYNKLWAKYTAPGPDGESVLDKMGGDPEALKKQLTTQLMPLKNFQDRLLDGSTGIAALHENLNKHLVDDRIFGWYTDKDAGDLNLSMAGMSKALGPGGTIWANQFATSQFTKAMTAENKAFTNFHEQLMLFPPNPNQPHTLQKSIDDTVAQNPNAPPSVFADYVKTIKVVADPSTPDTVRAQAIHSFFDPENRKVLDSFKTDYMDYSVSPPRMIPGKYSVFTSLTSPQVTHEIFKMGKTDPNLWQEYKNWAEESFGFKLFSGEIKDLNNVPEGSELKWHPENHQFTLETTEQGKQLQARGLVQQASIQGYQTKLDNLNMGLGNLSNIEKIAKGDVNAYLLAVLRSQGYGAQNQGSVAKSIIDGVKGMFTNKEGDQLSETSKGLKDQNRVMPAQLGQGQ